jgi:hypothetical protein
MVQHNSIIAAASSSEIKLKIAASPLPFKTVEIKSERGQKKFNKPFFSIHLQFFFSISVKGGIKND